jgi:flagellar basal body L-ring protein FlgH
MRTLHLVVLTSLVSAAACSSGPTESESLQIFAAASTAMASAQSRAVSDAQQALPAAGELVLEFSGPCSLGGLVGVTGSYDASGTADQAAFDMAATFDACREAQGTLDGSLRWASAANGTSFSATMKGDLDWSSNNGDSASCDFNLSIAVTAQTVDYSGHICGYDVRADLGIGAGVGH